MEQNTEALVEPTFALSVARKSSHSGWRLWALALVAMCSWACEAARPANAPESGARGSADAPDEPFDLDLIARSIYGYTESQDLDIRPWVVVDGEKMIAMLAQQLARVVELGESPGREVERMRVTLGWSLILELIGRRTIQLTYIGPKPSVDSWRCWRRTF